MAGEAVGLVADIGRQSVRFALTGGVGGLAPRDVQNFHTSEHPTFTSALLTYLAAVGQSGVILPSVLAVAGSARGDLINLTGSRWYISLSGVEAVLRMRPRALNECAATAVALTTLDQGAFTQIGLPPLRPLESGGNTLVINIGTGLGVAALVTTSSGKLVPVSSEAGHIAFAPSGCAEERFAARFRSRSDISAESLLSARGLVAAYGALSDDGRTLDSPEEVTRGIVRDPVAAAVARMFVGYLGSFIGDLVLAFGAWDGVYLTGSIARSLVGPLNDADFRHRITAKDAFRRQLGEVPVALVNRRDLELLGAAAALAHG